ncbi:VOC family protein [Halobacillus mangrovi]|uniref:Glyoxalase n=1 Tax=Halobacillus mangrovi TaxID=402384 RepID=A0A1W5ZWR4_9BACI|nr:VOC family protein [Halobacillus mangrovi]ARI77752.1 glyoxalase [Halobacillus mangrovi]
MIPQRVSLITLGAHELPKLRSFYQKLGWEETDISSDNYAVFKTAGVMLTLFPFEELEKDAGVKLRHSTSEYYPVTLAINVNSKQEVDEVIEQVRGLGAEILREPSDAFWGGRTSYFADPENNLWEVAWNPDSTFDERGTMLNF